AFLDTNAGEIVVLPSLGAGAFGAPVTSACSETADPIHGVDFAELDGDGLLDAVAAVWTQGASSCKCLQLLHGTGHGTFEQTITLFMGAALSQPRIRDVDGDGLLDLIALRKSGVVVRLALSGGGYAEPV